MTCNPNSKDSASPMALSRANPSASELTLGITTRGEIAELTLTNVSQLPLKVLSHVESSRIDLDWYTLTVVGVTGETRTLHLGGPRNESAVVLVELAPGKSLSHDVDIQKWAVQSFNGGRRFASGDYYTISAQYEVTESGDHWKGMIRAGPVPLSVH